MSLSCHSFESILRKWLRAVKPQSVLEWGPGKSTSIIYEECPNAEIVSIESQRRFANKAALDHPTTKVVFCPIPEYGPSEYPCWPLIHAKGKFYDFIFVDGRQRVSCLLTSLQILSQDGVVVLHDAKRIHYQHGIKLFDKVDDDGDTVVLKRR
jgi:predicted O-methyltransferase YrrM